MLWAVLGRSSHHTKIALQTFHHPSLAPIARSFTVMPPRKRAAAEVVKEEVAPASPARKRRAKQDKAEDAPVAETSTKASTTSAQKKPATAKKTSKAKQSNGNIAEPKEEERTAATSPKKKGKAKEKKGAVDIQLDPKVEEEVERLADAAAASPKKERKKKVKEDDDTPRHPSAPPVGGSKMDTLADPSIPKNMTIDDPLILDYTPKKEGTTRIMSWNVLSLKSSLNKGFMRYVQAEQADVVILTETKVRCYAMRF